MRASYHNPARGGTRLGRARRAAYTHAMPKPVPEPAAVPRASFDARLATLDQIVQAIDGGKLGLEESMERYREGLSLYKELKAEIEAHQARFEELAADGSVQPSAAEAR